MRLPRICLSLALLVLLTSSVLAQKVTTDFTKTVDFRQYKTFMWIMEPKPTNPLVRPRIISDVNSALTGKGLTLTTGQADLAIAGHAATQQRRTLDTFYDGFGGGWRWGGGFGSATTRVNSYEVGTLVIDIFDARTKEALWRGTSTKTLSDNPQKNADSLNKAIAKMFKDFPPSGWMRTN